MAYLCMHLKFKIYLSSFKLTQSYQKTKVTNHDIKKNTPFCNNPAELLTWKHALCEEFRN